VREQAERPQCGDDDDEHERQCRQQDAECDLVGCLAPLGALHQCDHAVKE
jgi:hypothetical protein